MILKVDFADKGKIPSRRGELADWYFHTLIPAIHRYKAVTGRQIPLRNAAYILKTGLKLFSRQASSAALQKDRQYKKFIRHNEAKDRNNERRPAKRDGCTPWRRMRAYCSFRTVKKE